MGAAAPLTGGFNKIWKNKTPRAANAGGVFDRTIYFRSPFHFHFKRDVYKRQLLATGSIFVGWLACQIFPSQIISIFGGESAEFTDFAIKCLRIYLFCIFCAGFQIVSTNYFQSTGQPLKASILSMLRQLLLLIPLILILPLFMGLNGILFSAPIADSTSALIVALFIIPEMKKLNRKIKEEDIRLQEAN